MLTLAVLAGGFITIGGLLSVLLAAGIATPGLQRLVEGVAFSAGFFFVVLSEAVLFTEQRPTWCSQSPLLETSG